MPTTVAAFRDRLYLEIPDNAPQALRDAPRDHRGSVILELCTRCWQPVLKGKLDAHLRAVQHRQPPMGASSPEG